MNAIKAAERSKQKAKEGRVKRNASNMRSAGRRKITDHKERIEERKKRGNYVR